MRAELRRCSFSMVPIQLAPDGLNFVPKAHVQLPPLAPGPFCLDAFADDGVGRGITWGLCHMNHWVSAANRDYILFAFTVT